MAAGAPVADTPTMEFEKVFDVTLDVPDPIHFCTDKNYHLINALNSRYAGRCFKGALITRVVRILKSSACYIVSSNGSGEGSVDVQFLATVKVFARWDILTGVVVRHVSHLIAGHYSIPLNESGFRNEADVAQAFVVLHPTRGAETLAVGQRIPVRITNADHPARQAAVAYGVLLTCERAAPTYRVRGSLDPAMATELLPILDRIEAELVLRAKLIPKRTMEYAFFESLLYSYSSNKTVKASAKATKAKAAKGETESGMSHQVSAWADGPDWIGPAPLCAVEAPASPICVTDIVKRALTAPVPVSGYWSRALCLHRSSPLAAFTPKDKNPDLANTAIEEPPRVVFALMLKNILDFLVATRELATTYETPELDESYTGLWNSMRMAQVPVPN